MDEKGFREILEKRNLPEDQIDAHIAFITQMEDRLSKRVPPWAFEDLNHGSTQELVNELIDSGENSIQNLLALARYAYFINNNEMYVALFQMLDGYESMDNLYQRLGEVVGDDLRDCVFDEMPLPPLGLSRHEKSRYNYQIMRRMDEVFGEASTRDLLQDSLRDLPDASYQEAYREYHEICEGDIDRFLAFKDRQFTEMLRGFMERGDLFFGQEITDDVIAFVDANPRLAAVFGQEMWSTKPRFPTIPKPTWKRLIHKRSVITTVIVRGLRSRSVTEPSRWLPCGANVPVDSINDNMRSFLGNPFIQRFYKTSYRVTRFADLRFICPMRP